jgi:hypothetical protein
MFPSPPPRETRHGRAWRVRGLALLAILGVLLWGGWGASAASAPSDWPSINADAGQSNANFAERGITAGNALKLKVKWTASLPDISYPVVAGGRVYLPSLAGKAIHARALDAASGKQVASYTQGAGGGILVAGGNLYLAGRSLEILSPGDGTKIAAVKGASTSSQATFTFPIVDKSLVLAGYSSNSHSVPNSLYAINAATNHVLWHVPSMNAQGAILTGRVLTVTSSGSAFYSETNGKPVASQSAVFSDWFGRGKYAYTVASVRGGQTTLYAFDGSGQKLWSRAVAPALDSYGWAHAVSGKAVYVSTLKPHQGIEALDPATGDVLWQRNIPGVQKIAYANRLIFVLSAAMGGPLQLIVLHAPTGKPLGAITISGGYYAFPTTNELMIADGMVFVRAINPDAVTELLALAP